MALWKKFILATAAIGVFLAIPAIGATLQGFQGGTGIATSTLGNDGNCLKQSSSSPFLIWNLGTCGSGGGGGNLSGSGTSTYIVVWNGPTSTTGYSVFTYVSSTGLFSAPTGTFTGAVTANGDINGGGDVYVGLLSGGSGNNAIRIYDPGAGNYIYLKNFHNNAFSSNAYQFGGTDGTFLVEPNTGIKATDLVYMNDKWMTAGFPSSTVLGYVLTATSTSPFFSWEPVPSTGGGGSGGVATTTPNTSGTVQMYANSASGAITDSIVYQRNDKIGIGTNVPFSKLNIEGGGLSLNTTSTQGEIFIGTDSSFNTYPGIWFGNSYFNHDVSQYTFLYDAGTVGSLINSPDGGYIQFRIGNDTGNGLLFDRNRNLTIGGAYNYLGMQKLDVEGNAYVNGSLGIGVTSPSAKLSVSGLPAQSTTSSLVLIGGPLLSGGSASGTLISANPTSTFNGDFINLQVGSTTKYKLTNNGFQTIYGTSTISLGGGLLTAGACTSTATIVNVSLSTSTDVVQATPQNYPGDGEVWMAYIDATGATTSSITVKDCAIASVTPAATKYNFVIQRSNGQ